MIVRELVAKFGIDFDPEGVKKAQGAMEGLKNLAAKVGLAISAGAVAKGLYDIVGMAAGAAESLSLLKVTFGANTDAMLAWADAQAGVLGRSKYSLREYAGAIGVVAKGLTGSEKAAAQIGQSFGALAVDLKAFFDLASDEEALGALRSALTGETEPLKRLGIVMDEAGLAAFALNKGHRTLWKDMDAAQKTMVRYAFIMESATVKMAGGAASREAGSFGNRIAALKDRFKDLSIELGAAFLPMAQKVLDLFDDYQPHIKACANIISDLATKTYFFEWVAGIAATVGGAKLLGMLISLYRVIRTQTLLAVGNLVTTVRALPAAFTAAAASTKAFLIAAAPIAGIIAVVALLGTAVYALYQTFTTGTNFIAEWTEEAFGLQTALIGAIGAVHTWFKETWASISDFATKALEKIRAKIAEVLPAGVLNLLAQVGVDLRSAEQNAGARTAGATVAPGSTVSSRNVNVAGSSVVVNVNGGATPATAQAVGREVQKALDNNNRNLAQTAPMGG